MSPSAATAMSAGWLNGPCSDGFSRVPSLNSTLPLLSSLIISCASLSERNTSSPGVMKMPWASTNCPVSPGIDKVAVAVEDQYRRVLPLVHVDSSLRIGRYVGRVPESHAGWERPKRVRYLVHVLAGAHD